MKNNKNYKFKAMLMSVIIGGLMFGFIFGSLFSNINTNNKKTLKNIFKTKEKVNIVKNEASTITYETFDNGLISLKIPKDWKVETPNLDYIHYSFKVYNPKNPNYMFLFSMKLEGFNKTQNAKDWQNKYYPNVVFAKLPVIDPQTTEAFYKIWNETADFVNTENVKSEYFPKFNDFTIIENLGANSIGGDILRATYTNNNIKNQGLFTASVKEIGTYYVNSNVFNLFSEKIDVSPLNVYNIIFMTAPDNEFNDWNQVLDNCLSTLKFSDTFVNGFNQEEASIMSNFKANQAIYDSISDGIMDSWEKRNNSYDIISQKQSDATLGYERVYDTDTGEIYKAYNGFMDDYSGTKYKTITDDMYTKKTSGYIEK
ncbi:MAG: hypothetical protein IKE75_04580 [Bacilli bacterium]|nr:hypothetical protein [Bacilli bacterium]